MGFLLTQKIIRAASGLTPTEKLTLISIADRVGDCGYSFPSIALIAREVGVGQRSIYRAIRGLEKGGFLLSKGITGKTSHYYVVEKALKSDIKCKESKQGGDIHDRGTPDISDIPPLTPVTLGGDTSDTLIDNIIDKGINKGEQGGLHPLEHFLPKIMVKVEGKKTLEQYYETLEKELIEGTSDITPTGLLKSEPPKSYINLETTKEEVEHKIKAKNMNTLDSIQSALDGTGLKQKKKQSPSNLWVRAVSLWRVEVEIQSCMPPMTQEDAGKLNGVAKKVGHRFPQVLKRCVEHWDAFTMYTSKANGQDCYPEQPSINFFVKNIGTAMTFDPNKKSGSDIKFNNENLLD